MATRPELHIAVAKTKSKASDYNDNFDMMMDFVDTSIGEAKDYVDGFMPSVTGKAGQFLTNDGTEASWVSLTGTILYYGFATAPSGWLVCDGSAISRTTYANLYSAIGTTFGEGDGSTTFNLPDLIDKFPQGNETVGTAKSAGLPNIIGQVSTVCTNVASVSYSGAFRDNGVYGWARDGRSESRKSLNLYFDASRSNGIYGNSDTVQPPALTLLPIIKY